MDEGFLNRLTGVMNEKRVKQKELYQALRLTPSTFSDWRRGKGVPNIVTVSRIAEYLDVSLDYLVFGRETRSGSDDKNAEISTPKEQAIMERFRRLSPDCQDRILSYADGMIAALSYSMEDAWTETSAS